MTLYPPMSAGLMLWLEASDEYDEEQEKMTLEREIELLKEKVALLERIKELQEIIAKNGLDRQPVYVPCPVYPSWPAYPGNPIWPIVTYVTGTVESTTVSYSGTTGSAEVK